VASGEWQVASGKWQVASGEWQGNELTIDDLKKPVSTKRVFRAFHLPLATCHLPLSKGEAVKHPYWILFIVVITVSVGFGHAQSGPNQESLKLAHEAMISGMTSGNMSLLQAMIHPRALGFFRESEFPAQIRGDYTTADALPSVITELGRFVAIPTTNTVYRVVGPAGIVCMASALEPKKGEKQMPRYLRGTYVYVFEDGKWKLISWHGSDTPLATNKK
jgi:hypothetical protein